MCTNDKIRIGEKTWGNYWSGSMRYPPVTDWGVITPGLVDNTDSTRQEEAGKSGEVDIFHFPQDKQKPSQPAGAGYKVDSPQQVGGEGPPKS